DPGTYWSPHGGLPQWIAVPLESPAAGPLFVTWDSTGYTYQNVGAAPRDYVLHVSSDSTDGRNGTWYEAHSVTGNQVRSRVDAISAAGARWVRLQTLSVGSYGPQLRRLEVFEAAPTPRQDGWLILGDSITAQSFHPGRATQFAATVGALAPGYAPFSIGAGTGGDTAAEGQLRLAAALAGWPPGTYVGLAYGTNDATRGVPVTTFKARLEQMARSILAAGCTPVIARIPYNKNGNLPAYVGAIDALTTELNLPPGPDLHSWFRAHPEELSSDTVHPNAQGEASIQRLWGEAAVRAYRWPE
ncbi:MAG: GDSL-type esterase/lipase family protein, partial [Candidatus Sericytochromatia bacterium]